MRPLALLLALGCAALHAAGDDYCYQFNGRASRAGTDVEALGGSHTGGGGGFAFVLGREALRLRLRLDGDTFPGRTEAGPVNTYGAGADAVLVLSNRTAFSPTFSVGLAFQQWRLPDAANPPGPILNKLAFRGEAGVLVKERFGLYVGALRGRVLPGRSVTCPYVGLSFNF